MDVLAVLRAVVALILGGPAPRPRRRPRQLELFAEKFSDLPLFRRR